MSRILTIGAGYVGLVTAACLAKIGHSVSLCDVDWRKVEMIRAGRLPIQEPGLEDLWSEGVQRGLLQVVSSPGQAPECEFVVLTVGTPATAFGGTDLMQLEAAVRSLAQTQQAARPVVVIKSTVPVGTTTRVGQQLEHEGWGEPAMVAANPEFLREGHAVVDFLRPDRIIVGSSDEPTAAAVAALYADLRRPVITCSAEAAEMIKYASNVFLCTKISFINELAGLCDGLGVDVKEVSQALQLDPRVGQGYLDAGLGWGGSCLPKDIRGLISQAHELAVATPLLESVLRVNEQQPLKVLARLTRALGTLAGAEIAVLGLTFKPNCDDLRDSPSLHLIRLLEASGARVRAYDPVATEMARALLPGTRMAASEYAAAAGADALVLACAWKQFLGMDLPSLRNVMRRPLLVDGRNALPSRKAKEAGFIYMGVGREQPSSLTSRVPEPVTEIPV